MAHNTTPSPSRQPKRTEKNWLKFLLTKVNERDMVSHNCSVVVEHVAIQQRKTSRPCYRFIHRNIWIKWGFNINTILLRNALIYLMKIEYPFGYTGDKHTLFHWNCRKYFNFKTARIWKSQEFRRNEYKMFGVNHCINQNLLQSKIESNWKIQLRN